MAVIVCCFAAASLWAMTSASVPGVVPEPSPTNSRSSRVMMAVPPPALPPPRLDFRQLLAMPAAEQEKALASRTPQDQQILRKKIQEFQSLSPVARETRLRALQLQVHLRALMRLSGTNRMARLATVPESDRPLMVERLEAWDRLPAEAQKEFLEHDLAQRVIASSRPAVAALPGLNAEKVEDALRHWYELPGEKRERLQEHFTLFFSLNEGSQSKVLDDFPEGERRQMQQTLAKFARLTPGQQDRCLAGFQKFAGLSTEERQEFLTQAQRWEAMPPEARERWRILVARASPPRPPMPVPLPPMPRAPVNPVRTATN